MKFKTSFGFLALLFCLLVTGVVQAKILVVAPHPDDDILMASGVIAQAKQRGEVVKVIFMTNGDFLAPEYGSIRQNEAVDAQVAHLGMNENDLIFLGYPDGYLSALNTSYTLLTDTFTSPHGFSQTYASRGLGATDYHSYRFGSPANYNAANVIADLADFIADFQPEHIITVSEYDQHPGHSATNLMLRAALVTVAGVNPGYAPVLNFSLVHGGDDSAWPLLTTPEVPYSEAPVLDSTPLSWVQRISIEVPLAMRSLYYPDNIKYQAIRTHASQGEEYLGKFLHLDEVFWSESLDANNKPPNVDAGEDVIAEDGSTVQLDGGGSYDWEGGALTYSWTQVAGVTVLLSSTSSATPTFTMPAGLGKGDELVFSLQVSDGIYSNLPDLTVVWPTDGSEIERNVAAAATVTASSETPASSQLAQNVIDGVIGGAPWPENAEWASSGEGAGAWVELTWAEPYVIDRIVLYDRPLTGEQITSAELVFSDASVVAVPTLDADGTGVEISFTPREVTSVRLNILAVSGTTSNVGLAEMEVIGVTPMALRDFDNDGLTNAEELVAGTDRLQSDSDGDGLSDGDEVNTHGSNPLLTDTDGDLIPDAFEVNNGLQVTVNDALLDDDNDGFSNLEEFQAGTDPQLSVDYPGANPSPVGFIHWSETDKNPYIQLTEDKMGIIINGGGAKGVRSNYPLSPGAGFYYFELETIQDNVGFGFGVATAAASLNGVGGQDDQSVVIDDTGGVNYNGQRVFAVSGSSFPKVYGIGVDYRGDYPVVHYIGQSTAQSGLEFLTSVPMRSVHEALYIYMYGVNMKEGEQARLSFGFASPLIYDPVAGMELGYYNGAAGLQAGWPIPDESPNIVLADQAVVILSGDSTSLIASANDVEDGVLTSQIEWLYAGSPIGSGASIMVSPAVGQHNYTARVQDQWGQQASRTVQLTVIVDSGADTDGDGLSYAQEQTAGTNPAYSDTDKDGLSDSAELSTHGTDPLLADTDGDSIDDGYEVANALNPLVQDANLDPDTDGFNNGEEFIAGTDAQLSTDYPGVGRVIFNAADAGNGVSVTEAGLKVAFTAVAGIRSDVVAAAGSGWHYFELTREYSGADYGVGVATASQLLNVVGGSGIENIVINGAGQLLYNGTVVATAPTPTTTITYGFAVDYSGAEPVVYVVYKDQYDGAYASLPPVTLTGVTGDLYIYAYGSGAEPLANHHLNAGENLDSSPFKYSAAYVLFDDGVASAEFMASGWGSSHAYSGIDAPIQQDSVHFEFDDNTNRLITLTDDLLGASFALTTKDAIIANQGMIGEFRYWEGHREIAPANIGFGLISQFAYKDPYCCVNQGMDGAPPSMSVNSVASVWRNLNSVADFDLANAYYGFAVDYRGSRPIVYVIMDEGVVATLTMDDFITPIYPMLYGSSVSPNLSSTANFGTQAFYYDAKVILEQAGVDTAEFVPGWGAHIQNSNLGNGTNTPPVISISAPTTVFLPDSVTLTATVTDSEEGDISGVTVWTDAFDGSNWNGASVTRTLSYGSHLITASATDSDGNTSIANITISVEQPNEPDSDGDFLVDSLEAVYGTDPALPDTDADGLTDFEEIFTYATDPLVADSDGDLMPDGAEISYGLNPLLDDAAGDQDSDGFTNLAEIQGGSDPSSALSFPGGPDLDLLNMAAVGNFAGTGSISWVSNSYHLISTAIDETEDSYQFAYTELSSDGEMIARVINPIGANVKAGLMLRSSLLGTADSSFIGYHPTGTFWTRQNSNEGRSNTFDHNGWWLIQEAAWLRLVRSGNTVTTYYGLDGINWTEAGSIQLNLGATIYVGVAVSANADGAQASADFSNFVLTQFDDEPVVTIAGGQSTMILSNSLSLTASATDTEDGDLTASINWSDDISSETAIGGSYNFAPLVVGLYTVSASVVDSFSHNVSDSFVVQVVATAGELDDDSDGLTNDEEAVAGTDPLVADTDGDGLSDGDEVNLLNTNPLLVDTDGDTMPDGYEVANNLSPTVDDQATDSDGDGISNVEEYLAGTDPNNAADYPGAPSAALDQTVTIGTGVGGSAWAAGVYTINSNAIDDLPVPEDHYQFTYRPLLGDGEIIVQVDSFTAAGAARGGLMIRSGLAQNSDMAFVGLSTNGTFFTYRDGVNGAVNSWDNNGWQLDTTGWLRLSRSGNTVTTYYSVDGTAWTENGSIVLGMSETAYIGLALAANNTGTQSTMVFSQFSLDQAPVVAITAPQSTIILGDSLLLSATASDREDGDVVASINWSDDVSAETAMGGSYNFTPVALGTYTVTAAVVDSFGHAGSDTVVVLVDADDDGDGLANTVEIGLGTDPQLADTDSDGLSDGQEVNQYLTDPLVADTDGDGMPDGYEVANGLLPTIADGSGDSDGDGISNVNEYLAGTNPQAFEVCDVDNTLGASVGDLLLLQRQQGGLLGFTAQQSGACDINHDGQLSFTDLFLLQKLLISSQ
jgi:LmbE family N-acetylglucosaminyl deacetylase/regulation of enolase protein 1 (concanavalin A-like superfamily)